MEVKQDYKNFDKLEPYLDKAIREIEQQEKYERDIKNLDNWIDKPVPIIERDRNENI